ncbi:unnamed protein product [Gadus morhua 'NCC']
MVKAYQRGDWRYQACSTRLNNIQRHDVCLSISSTTAPPVGSTRRLHPQCGQPREVQWEAVGGVLGGSGRCSGRQWEV